MLWGNVVVVVMMGRCGGGGVLWGNVVEVVVIENMINISY